MNLTTRRVARRLRSRATLFKKTNQAHGEEHLKVGKILNAMFPEGLQIKGEQKFSETVMLVSMLDKVLRGTNLRFKNSRQRIKDERVQDTLDDLGILSFMWAELIKNNAKKPSKRKSQRKLKELHRHKIDR
jgi:hypothetical protein